MQSVLQKEKIDTFQKARSPNIVVEVMKQSKSRWETASYHKTITVLGATKNVLRPVNMTKVGVNNHGLEIYFWPALSQI